MYYKFFYETQCIAYRADWTAVSWMAGWSLDAFWTIVSSDCVGCFSFSSESVLSVCGTLRLFSKCSSRLFCINNRQWRDYFEHTSETKHAVWCSN